MRFDLEVELSESGVLLGTLHGVGQDSPRSFHGLLELVALLEAATANTTSSGHGD